VRLKYGYIISATTRSRMHPATLWNFAVAPISTARRGAPNRNRKVKRVDPLGQRPAPDCGEGAFTTVFFSVPEPDAAGD
jgi:hypothetical protein